jgi:adenine-specific DNA-methyltransferase
MIFNYPKFAKFITNKEFLPDSYTEFESNIGLSVGDKFLSENREVVLSFPFKDCILEGGMDSEEAKNRKEIFYNQTLAPDDVHKLKSPKALKNWKKYTAKGEIPLLTKGLNEGKNNSPLEGWQTKSDGVDSLKLKDDGTFDENFIIKGNNLLALYSLLPRYKGKVKLIYIDPPYNTGNDGFKYNDNFNHSTWLTFMKNRLEVARELLRDDGVIFVQCDDNEQAYLKVLMDEVFGRENFVGTLIHQRAKGGGNAKHIVKGHDYVTIYVKNLSDKNKFIREKVIQAKVVEIDGESYIRNDDVVRKVFGKYDASVGDRRCFYEELEKYKNEKQILEINNKIKSGEYVLEEFGNGMKVIVKYTPVKESYSKLYSIVKALSEDGNNEVSELGLDFSNPKPEQIIKFLIESVTNPNDIVLDYHLGSGTTCAVAHKMGRRYIGVEQMNYIETIAVERLKKVVGKQVKSKDLIEENIFEDFDTGGISKAVQWQGGGDFIYLELAKNNIIYLEKIESLENAEQAWSLFEQLADSIWISYRTDIDKFREHTDQFLALELEDQKKVLRDIINYNHLYINYEDMEDIAYKDCGLSDEDKALTTQFYEKKQAEQNEIL